MTARFRFTTTTVARVGCPEGKDVAFAWDASLPGFGIIARPSGRRSWIAQYRIGRQSKRVALGDLNTVTLAEAREKAREILARAKLGHDPQAEKVKARAALTVLEVIQGCEAARGPFDGYLSFAKATMRPGSYENAERHLLKHAKPLHGQAMEQVQRAEIATLVRRVEKRSGPAAANKLRTTLAAMWKWAIGSGLIACEANPVLLVPKAAEKGPRSRVLTDAELALIWRCTAGGHDYDRIVRLLLLTGTRREEVGAMAWAEVEMAGDGMSATWTIPAARSKNGLPHEVALGPLAVAQLPKRREDNPAVLGDTETGFSGWSQSKARLDRRMLRALREDFAMAHGREPKAGEVTLPHWTLHDFRRTFSTWANETGIEPHVAEACLNHVSGAAKRGVAKIYNRATYRTQKAAALAAWEGHVREVVGLPPLAANVVPLRKAG
ncbi:MAG: site-specific integrase [Microbispora sp.]|nr:site-specific integrase [Microbispora sp.]